MITIMTNNILAYNLIELTFSNRTYLITSSITRQRDILYDVLLYEL